VFLQTASLDASERSLLCFDARTGKEIWKRSIPGIKPNHSVRQDSTLASATPTTDGESVFVPFWNGKDILLVAYNFKGDKLWERNFGEFISQHGAAASPILHKGLVIYSVDKDAFSEVEDKTQEKKPKAKKYPTKKIPVANPSTLYALDKKTGKTIWEVDRVTDAIFECKHSYASPFLFDSDQARFLVTHGADCTTGHDLSTGKEIWRFGMLNGPTHLNAKRNDPTFRFVASPCLAPNADTIIVPTAKEGPVIALKASALKGDSSQKTEAVTWNLPRTPDVSIPIIVDGLVYMLNKDGKLQCVELTTGKEVYFERTHSAQHRTSPVYADGHLYFGSNDGHVSVVKAGRTFELVSDIDMGEAITASVAVSNGTLFLRTYEALYAIR